MYFNDTQCALWRFWCCFGCVGKLAYHEMANSAGRKAQRLF
nr:MAG TPA: hypothetical protein [Caudoviricetes sp.]